MRPKYRFKLKEGMAQAGLIIGVFIGAAAGAFAAMMLAPQSGKQTRRQLKDLAGQQKEKLKNQLGQTRSNAANVATVAKEKLSHLADHEKAHVDIYAGKAIGTASGGRALSDKLPNRY